MARSKKSPANPDLSEALRNVAHKVRYLRETAGLSQNELARRSGVGQSTINELENGVANDVQLSTLTLLARAFQAPIGSLFAGTDLALRDSDHEQLTRAVEEASRNLQLIRILARRARA